MVENHRCRCPICSVERTLASDLKAPASVDRFRTLTVNYPALSDFESPSAVIAFLHSHPHDAVRSRQSNEIIKALLSRKQSRDGPAPFQDLLLLAFIPALHKTYRETRLHFTSLHAEDVAQQVLTSFLELAKSPALERRNGYLSASLSRGLRKFVFRWAIREFRTLPDAQPADGLPSERAEPIARVDFETPCLLREFLAHCLKTGALTHSEYNLLVKLKLEGFEAKELANGSSGLTPTAIHHRLQRIVSRLRRTLTLRPSEPQSRTTSQMAFMRRTGGKKGGKAKRPEAVIPPAAAIAKKAEGTMAQETCGQILTVP